MRFWDRLAGAAYFLIILVGQLSRAATRGRQQLKRSLWQQRIKGRSMYARIGIYVRLTGTSKRSSTLPAKRPSRENGS